MTTSDTRSRHHRWSTDPARLAEHRSHVAYDEQDAGHVVHPNGSLIGSLDRQFLGAAARHVLEQLTTPGQSDAPGPQIRHHPQPERHPQAGLAPSL